MQMNGAESRQEPREIKQNATIFRFYFLVIFLLFVVVMLLCINNIKVYKSYQEIRQYSNAYLQNQSLQEANREIIQKENKYSELIANSEENKKRLLELEIKNLELDKKNRELAEDNIALQNTLKMAASVGIKPQNYTRFNGFTSRGEINRGDYIGKFLGTAYTPSSEECGNNKGITNSGEPIIPGISVAVDSKYWPFGTVFYIKGLGYAIAMDTGEAIKGKNRFDFAVFDRNFAKILGQKYWEVYLIRMGNGDVNDIKL
jgi:3D (Asp-Asp-Asp) domain-containing protein